MENSLPEIAVAIIKQHDKYLLIKRKHKEGNLVWQFPAGKIESGEHPEDAAVREAHEETGIVCIPIAKIGGRKHPETGRELHYWLCEYKSGTASTKAVNEVEEVKWCTATEVMDYITSDLYENVHKFIERVN